MARLPLARDRRHTIRAGIVVEWITVGWMVIEVAVSVFAALTSGSIALMAFGLDSGIELLSAGVLLWRLGVEQQGAAGARVARAERTSAGIVGWTLLAIALYIVAGSVWHLWHHSQEGATPWGLAVAAAALVVMPVLVTVKRRIAREIGSAALRADATEGIVCTYMAAVLLVGLGLRAAFGLWWADPVAALGIVYLILREGREAIQVSRGHDDPCGHP